MSGWTTLEAHLIGDYFSEEGYEYIEEKVKSECDYIDYKSSSRVVGVLDGYERYPKRELIDTLSKYHGVAVTVTQVSDTSGTGTTELFIDEECKEKFESDNLCRTAMEELNDQYGVYLYASEYWSHISCTIEISVNENFESDKDGHVAVLNGINNDLQLCIRDHDDPQSCINAGMSERDARELIERLERYLVKNN